MCCLARRRNSWISERKSPLGEPRFPRVLDAIVVPFLRLTGLRCKNPAHRNPGPWTLKPNKRGGRSPLGMTPMLRRSVAVAASAAIPAAASAAAARLRARLVDRERPAAELLTREALDGIPGLAVVSELDESEPLGASRLPVGDHGHGLDRAVLGEEIAKILFARIVGKVANVQLHRN